MALQSGDVLRYALALALPDGVVGNLIFHYVATSGSGADEDTARTDLGTNITSALNFLAPEISSIVDSTTSTLWKWNTALKQWDGVAAGTEVRFSGTNSGEVLPNQNAAQMDFFTAVPRRQGRKFIPGYCESAQAGGDLNGTAIGHLVACGALLDNPVTSGGVQFDPCVFNTVSTSPYYETTEIFTGDVSIETYMSTQRRRKPGVGI